MLAVIHNTSVKGGGSCLLSYTILQLRVGAHACCHTQYFTSVKGGDSCLLSYTILQLRVGLVDTLTHHILQECL